MIIESRFKIILVEGSPFSNLRFVNYCQSCSFQLNLLIVHTEKISPCTKNNAEKNKSLRWGNQKIFSSNLLGGQLRTKTEFWVAELLNLGVEGLLKENGNKPRRAWWKTEFLPSLFGIGLLKYPRGLKISPYFTTVFLELGPLTFSKFYQLNFFICWVFSSLGEFSTSLKTICGF